ncbi:hypothetical protein GCM10023219_17000 [Stakelama sediminis]|uniref:Conjugal transfer protein TraD n=1 Tax=Stakelama sediminis TaxID=463200 RepID=A0A840YXH0_9SPHN|nr:conjugal transfer protein TraD [Stakelama sediminis]MBB5718431.1 hypothetical protein [Stakelama sediminis]
MRKPRDFDSELKALADKAKLLKERRVRQLGELVIATGADTLDADMLAGVLLGAATNKDASTKEAWRRAGAGFFQRSARKSVPRPSRHDEGAAPRDGDAASA